jgi:hypothetical protein
MQKCINTNAIDFILISLLFFIKYIAITLILEALSLLDFEIEAKEIKDTKSPPSKLPATVSSAESAIQEQ